MKKPILKVIVLLSVITVLSLMVVTGCKQAATTETTAAAAETTAAAAETTAAAAETTAAPVKLVFGNLPTAMSDEWNGYSTENFLYAAEKMGVEVQVLDAAWDGAKQLSNLEDLIIKGVDEIGVFVYTPEEAEKFAAKAKEAGIPISFENTKLMNYDFQGEYLFNVACEYDSIGYTAIKWVAENYDGAKIFYVRGLPGMGIVEAYEVGVEKALAESPNVSVAIRRDTQWDTGTAQPVVTDVLASGEEFDVVFANNESIAQGVYNALKDAGLENDIPIIATGGGPTGVTMLENGIIEATVASPVSLQGLYLFKAMYLHATQGITPPEKFIPLPDMPITKDTLDENISWIPSDDLIELIGGLESW